MNRPLSIALKIHLGFFLLILLGCQKQDRAESQPNTNHRQTVSTTKQHKTFRENVVRTQFQKNSNESLLSQSDRRFISMEASSLGIDFVHQWDPTPALEDRLNSYAIGVGVSIGDVNDDGLPDLFLACPVKGGRLYQNNGNWQFSDITTEGKLDLDGFWCTGTTFVDIDNDGDLDLYLCAFMQPNRLYINNGRGVFLESAKQYGLDFCGASVVGSFSDYDNDGHLDMYLVTNYEPPLRKITTNLERDENGKLHVPKEFEQYRYIINPPRHVAKPRMVEGAQYDILYRNQRDGSFSDVTESSGIGQYNHHGLSATWWGLRSRW